MIGCIQSFYSTMSIIIPYCRIQPFHYLKNFIFHLLKLIQHTCIFVSLNFFPRKTATHGKVHTFHTAVYVIHCSNNIYVFGYIKAFIEYVGFIRYHILILGFYSSFYSTITGVYTEEKFTEYFRNFTTVDFIDDENIFIITG